MTLLRIARQQKYYFIYLTACVMFITLQIYLQDREPDIAKRDGHTLNIIGGRNLTLRDKNCAESSEAYIQPFQFCTDDIVVKKYYQIGFEVTETQIMMDALNNYPRSTLLDIGANQGLYSIMAGLRGHRSIAVEPSRLNIEYLYTNAVKNGIEDKIMLVYNAVSDTRAVFYAALPITKQIEMTMEIRMVRAGDNSANDPSIKNLNTQVDQTERIESVRLLDVLQYTSHDDVVIIKIDVEGHECKVLQEFLNLPVKTGAYVPYILMEWHHISDPAQQQALCPDINSLIEGFVESGYLPLAPEPVLIKDLTEFRFKNILWKHKNSKDLPILQELKEKKYEM